MAYDCSKKLHLLNLLFVLLILNCIPSILSAEDKVKIKCETCNDIAENFKKGLERTAKDGFGGGNTQWEESRLGSFRFSETRLVDITEKLCKGVTHSNVCHAMLEEQDETIEDWWFKVYKAAPDTANLRQWLCVDKIKHCCPLNQFGVECATCPTCGGRGACAGNGTRSGDGKCECEHGYKGDACGECASDHFVAQNATESQLLECDMCDPSCDSTKGCTGSGNDKCVECGSGYRKNDENQCIDIDECLSPDTKCAEKKYCVNNEGGYTCENCHKSCGKTCTGASDLDCEGVCAAGYELKDKRCVDRDECNFGDTDGNPVCTDDNEMCSNNPPGSYTCECKPGFHRLGKGSECVKVTVSRQGQEKRKGKTGGGTTGAEVDPEEQEVTDEPAAEAEKENHEEL